MNIAFCYESVLPARGGCETYISDLARRLAADGHEVHLYACRWDEAALPEVLAVDAGPHQAAVRIDVHLADAELRGGKVLVRIDAFGALLQLAARCVDPRDLVLRYRRRAVHDERESGQPLLNLENHVEVQPLRAAKLVGPVARADGDDRNR